jgi:hypothetical protein
MPPDTFLELAFPADTSKSAYATEQLHILLRSQVRYRSFLAKLAGYKQCYSLELVSSKNEGIRYILVIPSDDVEHISSSLLSFMPGLKIRQVSDYLQSLEANQFSITEVKLAADFVLPLKSHAALDEHDPAAFLTGHMTKLLDREVIAVQMVTTPVLRSTHLRVLQRVRKVCTVIGRGESLSRELNRRLPREILVCLLLPLWLASIVLKLLWSIIALFFGARLPIHSRAGKYQRNTANPYEYELANNVKDKLDQNLFEVSIRILVASDNLETITNRTNDIIASYHMFANSYQSITTKRVMPISTKLQQWQSERLFTRFRKRSLSVNLLSHGIILAGSELSDLYHFPNSDLTKTAGLIKSRSRELPAPLSLKHSDTQLDVVLGTNTYGGEESLIGLTLEQRQKHVYVVGKTGTGKTTLLTNAIYQDMLSGKGVGVLDPHGDMFRELLEIVPESRRGDVIVFDPSDRQYPIGLNILAPGIHFDSQEDEYEWITSMVLSVFEKLSDETYWGPRMEHILRSATLTALQLPNPTLYTLQRLLTDKRFQKHAAYQIKDPVLQQFWAKELAMYGDRQLASMAAPLTNRLGNFITTLTSRHILMQERSTINISDIINDGKILLVNLSKGDIGENNSFFFGTLLSSLIWVAACQRTKIPEAERKDFFLYIDEFQNFATPQFTNIISEGRKFHIALTASHQNVAQIKDIAILKTVAANAGSIICLKASPDDEDFILPFMEPAVEKGDIVNLAPHNFYMKTTTEGSEEAFSGTTIPLAVNDLLTDKDAVLDISRVKNTVSKKVVEHYLEELFSA